MQEIQKARVEISAAQIFAFAFLSLSAFAALLIAWKPLQLSMATIFLFAGLHNLFEFRYFAARMPVKWGKSRTFYTLGIGGTLILTAIYLAIYFSSGWLWNPVTWQIFAATWNTAFALWIALLIYLRGRQKPQTDWSWAFPVAFFFAALAWLVPNYWALSLIYLHPLVAMYFFDRQLRRTKPEWRKAYHFSLLGVGIILIFLWITLANAPHLPNDTDLNWRITQHAGSEILPQISSRLLVTTHVFLETIHYSVWIILLPLIDKKAVPWNLGKVPLVAHPQGFPKVFLTAFALGLLLVVALFLGFSVNYTTTRDIYFAFAIGHVLAEMPFLIKML